jgi:hypothetical protein
VSTVTAPRADPVAVDRRQLPDLLRRGWQFAGPGLAAFVACRLACLTAFAFAARTTPLATGDAPFRWDGSWYLRVATGGYPSTVPHGQSTLGFFPVFPLASRGLAAVTPLSTQTAMLVVGFVSGAVFSIALWQLLLRVATHLEAQRALVLVLFFPGAFILSMAYSEPVMLAFLALSLVDLLDGRWVRAGVWGALATATRPNALALVPAGLFAAWLAYRRGEGRRAFLAPALTPVGFLAFMLFLRVRTGDLFAYFHAQRDGWNMHTDFGATTTRFLWHAARHPTADFNQSQVAIGTLLVVVLLVYAWRRVPMVLYVYALAAVALAVSSNEFGARPRAILTAFPLLLPLARPLRDLSLSIWIGLSMTLLVVIAWTTSTSLLLTP